MLNKIKANHAPKGRFGGTFTALERKKLVAIVEHNSTTIESKHTRVVESFIDAASVCVAAGRRKQIAPVYVWPAARRFVHRAYLKMGHTADEIELANGEANQLVCDKLFGA